MPVLPAKTNRNKLMANTGREGRGQAFTQCTTTRLLKPLTRHVMPSERLAHEHEGDDAVEGHQAVGEKDEGGRDLQASGQAGHAHSSE